MNTIGLNFLVISVVVALGFTSCKSEKIPPPLPNPAQKLNVTLQPVFGSEVLHLDSVYTTAEGYDVKFTSIKFFVSGISSSNGASLDAALFDYGEKGTSLFEMEGSTTNASTLTANLGVISSLNHSDPSGFPATSPLNILNSSDLHWGWNPGYIFVQVFAQADTIQDGNALFDHFITFHVGRDEYLQPLEFNSVNWVKVNGTTHRYALKLDLQAFLQNGSDIIDLKTEYITHTSPGQEALSLKVIQNFKDAISPYQMKYFLILFLGIVVVLSCRKEKVGFEPTPYELEIPSHFPKMIIPANNPMTVEGVALGRKLFYEKLLSKDNTISCGSCHAPANAMSDPNQFSEGVDGQLGNRNSMALINLGWDNAFFWDGRAKTLEDQIFQPVTNPVEMHETWPNAVAKLQKDVEYRNMFFMAFGEEGIDSVKVSKAIAQFVRTMISGKSKYDVMYKSENGLSLTAEEQAIYATVTNEEFAGYDLFKSLNGADCFHCHNGPLMRIQTYSNNGLDATFTDLGRGEVTGNPADYGKFKVPTLRNIAVTGPYMHDGRFETLDEVLTHYSFGIQSSPTIDPLIEFASQGGVQLDAFERNLVKLFLHTLTDETFINNPDFKEPQQKN